MYEEKENKPKRFFKETKEKKHKKKMKDEVSLEDVSKTLEITEEVEPVIEKKTFFKKITLENIKNKFKKSENSKPFLGIKADWTSIFIKMLLLMLIAFLVIFVVTKLRAKGHSFEENLEKMKEVSYTYYKVSSHRPVLVDEEVVMSLEDMIKASLISELIDKNNNVCSKEYSYVSLINRGNDTYELTVYLSCGGESKSAFYEVNYPSKSEESVPSKVVLYELRRNVKSTEMYTCPSGYEVSGRYCIKSSQTVSVAATPKYRVIPEINRPAIQKSYGSNYEYVEPILLKNDEYLKCPSGYTLRNGKCELEGTVKYNQQKTYKCVNGGTPSGRQCLFTTSATYNNEEMYCKNGESRNGRCYLKEKYSVRCIYGSYDSSKNSCYTTYASYNELSDWLFDSIITVSSSKSLVETEKVRYEKLDALTNGKVRYKKYVKVNKKTCNNGDLLDGRTCRHYDTSYEERYCKNSKYSLTSDKSECFVYEDMSVRKTSGEYLCPSGYSKRGSGVNTSCYKYEAAQESVEKTAYCSSNYSLTSDERCVRVLEPSVINEEVYSCPDGFTKQGTGAYTKCYKKVEKESYLYCSNSEAVLVGERCIIPEKTEFVGYTCPAGYRSSGTTCLKTNVKETILATKNEGDFSSTETIWSKTKDLDGWIWTGNTKEEEV